jgi:rhamnogalacturonan endolyase
MNRTGSLGRALRLLAGGVFLVLVGAAQELRVPPAKGRVRETLGRSLVAMERTDGTVYLGWRLLAGDPAEIAFDVYRAPTGNRLATVTRTTDFVDRQPPTQGVCTYWVAARTRGREPMPSAKVTVDLAQAAKAYLSIKLPLEVGGFMHPMVADLDGDGSLDYVVKTPDSYLMPDGSGWHPDSRTYKMHAVTQGGRQLWRNDLGPAIEMGNWYSPHLAYDFDGDGKAEIAVKTGETINDPKAQPIRDDKGRVIDDREYLSIWDGATGAVMTRVPWPSREGYKTYNLVSRNLMGVAYLDGRTPAILAVRGTYGHIKIAAHRYRNRQLEKLWEWDSRQEEAQGYHGKGDRGGSGSHFMHAADVDGDGRDEVIYGSFVLDDNGKGLWALERTNQGDVSPGGHPDGHYVGDILPSHPGLEIFYTYEKWHNVNGACLVDARTGKLIWGTKAKTGHFHKAGLCADIDARHPGMECYGKDHELSKERDSHSWLWAADGTVLGKGNEFDWGSQPWTVHWDADLQREVIRKNTIVNYPENKRSLVMEGCARTILVADILGDWREEIIRSTKGNELRIYTTTIPAKDRRPTLLQDPIYRIDVANNGMGYPQAPMLTRCLEPR